MVECRTPEREVRGSKPTATVLCPWARHFTPRKYWLITQEAMAQSRHDWKIVDWDVKPQHNQQLLKLLAKMHLSRIMKKLTKWMCAQQRLRSAWAVFAVRMKKVWVLSYPLSAQRRLIRLGRCPGWSEFSLGARHFVGFVMMQLIWYVSAIMILSIQTRQGSVDPDKTVPRRGVWSGSKLFAIRLHLLVIFNTVW